VKILVTGGTGFTGRHLCKRLASNGFAVRALVRDLKRSYELQQWGVELVLGDIRDRNSLEKATIGVDLIYNIAAVYRKNNATRMELWETHVRGNKNLLDAAIDAGVKRFVHCSTVGVHGHIVSPPADENSPYAPGDSYQQSKTEGEIIVNQYMKGNKIPIVVFRPCGIYGPGDLRFLKLLRAIKKGFFLMIGSGEVYYHMIYIDDLIEGILLCGTKKEAIGNVYILGGENYVTLNRFIEIIADVLDVNPPRFHIPFAPVYYASILCEFICKPLGINPPLYRRRVDFFRKNRAFDIAKAKLELGFQPKVDLKTGLIKTARWYQREGLL
jgi:nucleoside-diphosphate-sugar epimerase